MEQTYKIGEAAALLNLKTYVLRFWETEFPQIAPLRTEKGQRLYTQNDLDLQRRIQFLLHEQGLTIDGARRALVVEARRSSRDAKIGLPLLPMAEKCGETPLPTNATPQAGLPLFAAASPQETLVAHTEPKADAVNGPETLPEARPEAENTSESGAHAEAGSDNQPSVQPELSSPQSLTPVASSAEQAHTLPLEAMQVLVADLEEIAEILRGNHDIRKFLQ